MDEFDLIDRLKQQASTLPQNLLLGIGDDAAVFKGNDGFAYLITTDTYNQGIHFDLSFQSPLQVAYRSVVASISDIAAMGGIPLFLQFSFSIPVSNKDIVSGFMDGVISACEDYAISIGGGDTVSIHSGYSLSFTVIGRAREDCILCRNAAKAGDTLYLTGATGWASQGLKILTGERVETTDRERAIRAFLYPSARVEIGRRVAALKPGSGAAIDISDGLAQDSYHIANASKASLVFRASLLKTLKIEGSFMEDALYGGDDYELLISHPFSKERLAKDAPALASSLFPIGYVTDELEIGVYLKDDTGLNLLPNKGWKHTF